MAPRLAYSSLCALVQLAILLMLAMLGCHQTASAQSLLANLSTRGFVGTGDDVMILGLIINGTVPKTVLIRALGPSLADADVPNTLSDPTLQLFSGQTMIASNDDWGVGENSPASEIQATGKAPANSRESALLITLDPGPYTAIVRGLGDTTGNALVDMFDENIVPVVYLANPIATLQEPTSWGEVHISSDSINGTGLLSDPDNRSTFVQLTLDGLDTLSLSLTVGANMFADLIFYNTNGQQIDSCFSSIPGEVSCEVTFNISTIIIEVRLFSSGQTPYWLLIMPR